MYLLFAKSNMMTGRAALYYCIKSAPRISQTLRLSSHIGRSHRIVPLTFYSTSTMTSPNASNSQPTARGNPFRERREQRQRETADTMYYASSVVVVFIGLSFAAVPLYQLFCSTTGIDGTPKLLGPGTKFNLSELTTPDHAKPVKIFFDSSTSALLPWKFEAETRMITVKPGESALAFFKAQNMGDERVTGISTYSVVPYKAAQYFNKIQVSKRMCLLVAGRDSPKLICV